MVVTGNFAQGQVRALEGKAILQPLAPSKGMLRPDLKPPLHRIEDSREKEDI